MGAIAAQLIHAAGESSPGNLPEGTIAIALSAKDEPHLLQIEAALKAEGIAHRAIREPDPPYFGALMAIGLPPQEKPQGPAKKILGRLPLLGAGRD